MTVNDLKSKASNLVVNKYQKSNPSRKSVQRGFLLPTKISEKLNRISRQSGLTNSMIVRLLVENFEESQVNFSDSEE